MSAKSIIAIAALSICAGSAFAADNFASMADYGTQIVPKSTRTRAEVKQELQRAQVAGEIVPAELYGELTPSTSSTLSRSQVHADAVAYAMHQAHSFSTKQDLIGG